MSLSFFTLNQNTVAKKRNTNSLVFCSQWNETPRRLLLLLIDLKNLTRRSNIAVSVVHKYLNRKFIVEPTDSLKAVRTTLVISHSRFRCFVKFEALSEIEMLLVLSDLFSFCKTSHPPYKALQCPGTEFVAECIFFMWWIFCFY